MTRTSIIRYALHVAVLTTAIALVFALMPGVRVQGASLILFIVLGLGLALLNAIVRPVLVMLTGRLLIASMGLFVFIVNSVVFWLLVRIFQDRVIIDSPSFLRILIASALITLVATVLEAVLGLNRPDVTISGQGQGVWALVDRLPIGHRSALLENIRLQQVYDTLMAYGVDIAAGRTSIGSVRRWVGKNILHEPSDIDDLSTPAKVRVMLQQLGPTWVKIGQIASSQAGTMPKEWVDELAKLQNTVAPFPFPAARDMVEEELKHPLAELFATFEEVPLAAASTAQVHRAMLPDGRKVVVKVQRPYIRRQTAADLGVMESVAATMDKRVKAARALDLPGTVKQFGAGVMNELDYTIEAYNAQRLADVVKGIDKIHIVGVHPDYSTSRVLTMDLVDGVKVTNTAALDAAGVDREAVAEAYIKALSKQILIDGFFHGDPHPGNLFVNPATGDLTMLDCGLVGELSQTQRFSLLDLMYSLQRKDVDALANVMLTFCTPTRRANYAAYHKGVRRLIYQYVVYQPVPNLAGFMNALLGSLFDYGLRMDSNLSLAIKAILQAMEAGTVLNPGIDWLSVLVNTARDLIREQITPDNVRAVVEKEAVGLGKELIRRAPNLREGALKWIDNLSGGGVMLKVDTTDLSKQVDELDLVLRRLVIGLVLGSLIIGTAIVGVGAALSTIALAFFVNQAAIDQQAIDYLQTAVPLAALGIFAVVAVASLFVIWRMARPPGEEA
jgi:ubiquinone biosynthesis protein